MVEFRSFICQVWHTDIGQLEDQLEPLSHLSQTPILEQILILPFVNELFHLAVYEAYKRKTGMALIAMQPNVPDDAYMSHMKGMYVPFNMAYGSFIYH